jgi:branched-chain amino acid transport system ATP-binding protein
VRERLGAHVARLREADVVEQAVHLGLCVRVAMQPGERASGVPQPRQHRQLQVLSHGHLQKDMPDDRRIFPDLSVERNLALGARHNPRGAGGYWNFDTIYQLFPPLREFRTRKGAVLSGGEQKMLALGRALMGNPKLLMLDEPSEGLSPVILSGLVKAIQKVCAEGMTILIADQTLKFARRLANYAYIVENGIIRHQVAVEGLLEGSEGVRKYLAV